MYRFCCKFVDGYTVKLEGYGKHAFRSTIYNEGTQLYFK